MFFSSHSCKFNKSFVHGDNVKFLKNSHDTVSSTRICLDHLVTIEKKWHNDYINISHVLYSCWIRKRVIRATYISRHLPTQKKSQTTKDTMKTKHMSLDSRQHRNEKKHNAELNFFHITWENFHVMKWWWWIYGNEFISLKTECSKFYAVFVAVSRSRSNQWMK